MRLSSSGQFYAGKLGFAGGIIVLASKKNLITLLYPEGLL